MEFAMQLMGLRSCRSASVRALLTSYKLALTLTSEGGAVRGPYQASYLTAPASQAVSSEGTCVLLTHTPLGCYLRLIATFAYFAGQGWAGIGSRSSSGYAGYYPQRGLLTSVPLDQADRSEGRSSPPLGGLPAQPCEDGNRGGVWLATLACQLGPKEPK